MTTLSSKIINVHKQQMAQIAVDAVMAVANLERNDVNFDMIKASKAKITVYFVYIQRAIGLYHENSI